MHDGWIEDWLGSPRFQRYLDECAGDRSRALRLYEWNTELGLALLRDISHFEVALRNAYDKSIQASWRAPAHWLLDPESPVVTPIWRVRKDRNGLKRGSDVNYRNRRSVDEAIQRCGGVKATPGKVMAELSLGFWSNLTSAALEKTLWVPHLHRAFPRGTSRKQVDEIITNVNTVRNRIAHHEPVFDRRRAPRQQPTALHQDLMGVLTMIAPSAAHHLTPTSSTLSVLQRRP